MNRDFNLGFAARKSMVDADGRFSYVIPLSHIFGFCRDVRKVIFSAKHTIVLQRKGDDNDAIWRAVGVPDGEVTLSKLSLWMPLMSPSISEEQRLLFFMDTGGKSLLSWGTTTTDAIKGTQAGIFTWHISSQQGVTASRHIFIAFQNYIRLEGRSSMIFDTLNVSEVSLK